MSYDSFINSILIIIFEEYKLFLLYCDTLCIMNVCTTFCRHVVIYFTLSGDFYNQNLIYENRK